MPLCQEFFIGWESRSHESFTWVRNPHNCDNCLFRSFILTGKTTQKRSINVMAMVKMLKLNRHKQAMEKPYRWEVWQRLHEGLPSHILMGPHTGERLTWRLLESLQAHFQEKTYVKTVGKPSGTPPSSAWVREALVGVLGVRKPSAGAPVFTSTRKHTMYVCMYTYIHISQNINSKLFC